MWTAPIPRPLIAGPSSAHHHPGRPCRLGVWGCSQRQAEQDRVSRLGAPRRLSLRPRGHHRRRASAAPCPCPGLLHMAARPRPDDSLPQPHWPASRRHHHQVCAPRATSGPPRPDQAVPPAMPPLGPSPLPSPTCPSCSAAAPSPGARRHRPGSSIIMPCVQA